MTPSEALDLLTRATDSVPASRTVHQQILAALQVLRDLVQASDKTS